MIHSDRSSVFAEVIMKKLYYAIIALLLASAMLWG